MSTPQQYDIAEFEGRHPSVLGILRFLVPNPRLSPAGQDIAHNVWISAVYMCRALKDGPELAAGLRKLLEAKDCFVRQVLVDTVRD